MRALLAPVTARRTRKRRIVELDQCVRCVRALTLTNVNLWELYGGDPSISRQKPDFVSKWGLISQNKTEARDPRMLVYTDVCRGVYGRMQRRATHVCLCIRTYAEAYTDVCRGARPTYACVCLCMLVYGSMPVCVFTHTHALSFSLSHTHTPAQMYALSLSLSVTLSLSHTHTNTHTHTHSKQSLRDTQTRRQTDRQTDRQTHTHKHTHTHTYLQHRARDCRQHDRHSRTHPSAVCTLQSAAERGKKNA
jgi:hypothetical protein